MSAAPLPARDEEVQDERDRAILMARLRRFRRLSLRGEESRRASDRKGAKLFHGKMWEAGITQGRLPITANQAVALTERFIDMMTKSHPIPEVQAVNGASDDAAKLLEGALLTNWRRQSMQFKVRRGSRLAMFTRPILGYVYWDTEQNGGIGDVATRMIPAHRCIIDNRHERVQDMEFVGFSETMTRAKAIMLFPDKSDEIEDAVSARGGSKAPGVLSDPLELNDSNVPAGSVSRLVQSEGSQSYVGTQSIRYGGRHNQDPLAEDIDVEFLWVDDATPEPVKKPKIDRHGFPVYRFIRDEDERVQYEIGGYDVVHHPLAGPMYVPNVQPKRELVLETHVVKKYPYRRHIAWIPTDNVILWDVKWDGPIPLATLRANVPFNGYWNEGPALRLTSLAIARNVLYTIIFTRLKLSMSGTFLATPRSGLKRNRLSSEDGQVFYAHKIGSDDIRQFPVQPVDAAYFTLLDRIETEMMALIGMTAPLKGEATGRADSSSTYDALLETGGASLVGAGQLLEMFVEDWAKIDVWWMQQRYTREHYVEVMEDEGASSWRQASALAMRGEFAITIETGSMAAYSERAKLQQAVEFAQMGFYPMPLLGKVAHIPYWRRALRMKQKILESGPQNQWLAGPTPQPPTAQKPPNTKRSHHKKVP